MIGKRNTRQRAAVLKAIDGSDRPLSILEIMNRAKKHVPTLGQATVYRILRELGESGQLIPVQLPGLPTRYESADQEHHHHFHCQDCGKLFDLPGCLPRLGSLLPEGFTMESHDLTLHGRCSQCAVK